MGLSPKPMAEFFSLGLAAALLSTFFVIGLRANAFGLWVGMGKIYVIKKYLSEMPT